MNAAWWGQALAQEGKEVPTVAEAAAKGALGHAPSVPQPGHPAFGHELSSEASLNQAWCAPSPTRSSPHLPFPSLPFFPPFPLSPYSPALPTRYPASFSCSFSIFSCTLHCRCTSLFSSQRSRTDVAMYLKYPVTPAITLA